MCPFTISLNSLNPEQKQAVEQVHGPLVILAGAGTGKTRVITYRIAYMIAQGINPSQIVALTFTNKAAKEMRERVTELAGSQAKGIHIGTFHSFCLKILRLHARMGPFAHGFSLIGTGDQLDLLKRAIEEKGWSGLYQPYPFLEQISKCKNLLLEPDEVRGISSLRLGVSEADLEPLSQVYALYQRQLRLNRVIDFDDCIFEFIKLLRDQPERLQRLQENLNFFLIDEFQDTNQSQLAALRLMAEKSQNACVVGDDDQSIYSWRGAEPRIIEEFESYFPGAHLIKLEQNYRCTNVILNAANKVIANNVQRKPKVLWSSSQEEIPIGLIGHPDEIQEARWLAKKVFGFLGQGYRPKDISVLYRTNNQGKTLEIAFREMGIKYKIFGGSSFFEKKEIKDFLAYFKLSMDPHHRLSYWRIINTPTRGVGLKTQERIEDYCRANKISPYEGANHLATTLKGPGLAGIQALNAALSHFAQTPPQKPEHLRARGRELIKAFKLDQDIRNSTSNEKSRQAKLENLARLPEWLEKLAHQTSSDGTFNIDEFLDQLMLNDDLKNTKDKDSGDYVSLMTIHSSKGLEFPVVFLPGLEDDILPHKNAESPKDIAEERRLFYVALTRAKKHLLLSYALKRASGFQSLIKRPSRFLKELPEENLKVESLQDSFEQPEDLQSKRLSRLKSLRADLTRGFSENKPTH